MTLQRWATTICLLAVAASPLACAKSYIIPIELGDRFHMDHGRLVVVNETGAPIQLRPRSCHDAQSTAPLTIERAAGLRLALDGVIMTPEHGRPDTRRPSYEIIPEWAEYVGPSPNTGPDTVLLVSAGANEVELRLDFEQVERALFEPWRTDGNGGVARPTRPTFVVEIEADDIVDLRYLPVSAVETCQEAEQLGIADQVPGCP